MRAGGRGGEKGSACQLSYVEVGGNYIGRLLEPSMIKSYLCTTMQLESSDEIPRFSHPPTHAQTHTHMHTHPHTHIHTHTHTHTRRAGIAALSSTCSLSCWPEPLLCCYLSRDQSEKKTGDRSRAPHTLCLPTLAHERQQASIRLCTQISLAGLMVPVVQLSDFASSRRNTAYV